MTFALPLLALTLGGVLARPRGASEWLVAVLGAAGALLVGAIAPADALAALADRWDVFLFFLGLMSVAAVADQSGVVDALTRRAVGLARGRRDVLLVVVSGVAVVVTVTLSNDATVLVLTPLVIAMARRLGVPALPYAFACAWLANAASLALPIANPANILVLRAAPLGLRAFVTHLGLPALAAVAATVVALLLVFRRDLGGPLESREETPRDEDALLVGIGIAGIVGAYLVALDVGLPVGIVAALGGVGLVGLRAARRRLDARRLRDGIAWGVFPFLAGLVVVVTAAERAGLADAAAAAIRELAAMGSGGLVLLGLAATLAANAMNNLPLALLAGAGLERVVPTSALGSVVGALLVGIDVGPNFTTLGSMATLMWLLVLRRRGIRVGSGEYLRRSWLASLLALGAALAAVVLAG